MARQIALLWLLAVLATVAAAPADEPVVAKQAVEPVVAVPVDVKHPEAAVGPAVVAPVDVKHPEAAVGPAVVAPVDVKHPEAAVGPAVVAPVDVKHSEATMGPGVVVPVDVKHPEATVGPAVVAPVDVKHSEATMGPAVVAPVDVKHPEAAVGPAVVAPVDVKQPADFKQAMDAARPRVRNPTPVRRYDGHVVAKVVPTTKEQLDDLHTFFKVNGQIDVWRPARMVGEELHFMVTPEEYTWVSGVLEEKGLKSEVIVSDVQRIIDNQTATFTRVGGTFGWDSYYGLSSMYSWMQSLTSTFPGVATLVDGGLTHEGRHMLGVRVAYAPNLPIVFLEGGIHGREWIAPAVTTYILNQLLSSSDPRVQRVARSFEWHVFPSVNPDAYEYTHTSERLWRKSRKRYTFQCYGADLNRNFPYHWGTSGVSWDSCSETYPGSSAASEVETRYRISYMEPLLPRMKAFIALHSYSQLLIFPWGDSTYKVDNYDALFEVGSKAAQAFTSRHGTPLVLGNLATVLYPASGSSMDWVHSQGVPFTFTYELRPGQNSGLGGLGFLLPANQILPAAEETTDSVVTMLNAILDRW